MFVIQLYGLETWQAFLMELKSRFQQGCGPYWRLLGRIYIQLSHVLAKIAYGDRTEGPVSWLAVSQGPVAAPCRLPTPLLLSMSSRRPFWSCRWLPSQSQLGCLKSFSYFRSDFPFYCISLPLPWESFLLLQAHVDHTGSHGRPKKLPTSKPLTLMTSAWSSLLWS